MAAQIHNVESYCQTFIKKGLHVLPYAVPIIFIMQLIIQKITFYLNEQLNQFIGFIILLLNFTIEDKIEDPLYSSEDACRENNIVEGNTIGSDNFNKFKVDAGLESSSNTTCSTQDFDESVSDIEILRGGSDDEMNNKKFKTIEETIDDKIFILQKKRQDLCNRLLAYKLMDFQIDSPLIRENVSKTPLSGASSPSSTFQSPIYSPLPIADELNFEVPIAPATQQRTTFDPEYIEYEGGSFEGHMAQAMRASLNDGKTMQDSNLSQSQENYVRAKLPGQSSTAGQGTSKGTAISPNKIRQEQISPKASLPLGNISDESYARDLEKQEARKKEDSENVMEDFIETERYAGDKGKRPRSDRYAYKKRAKPSKSEFQDPGPSGSG